MLRVAVVIAGLLCSSAQAQQRTEPPPAPDGSDAGSTERTLSKEDAELLNDLAVLLVATTSMTFLGIFGFFRRALT